jgi:hypothetical protein
VTVVPRPQSYAFFTVCSSRYFPGLIALLNSLRLTGHSGPLFVLDVDLRPEQRMRLEGHCTLVRLDTEEGINPLLLKGYPEAIEVDDVAVIIDNDVIVTGSLMPAVELAQAGQICVYADADDDRWFSEWQHLFSLSAPPRRQTYVNSGFIVFSTRHWPTLLGRWRELSEAIPTRATRAGGAEKGTPFWDGDQDALNALLMSEISAEAIHLLPRDEAPTHPRDRAVVTIQDERGLICTCRGTRTVMLHAAGDPKPWQVRRSALTRDDCFARLLPRVLFADDVTLRASKRDVPLGYRPGWTGRFFPNAERAVLALGTRFPRGLRRIGKAAVARARAVL